MKPLYFLMKHLKRRRFIYSTLQSIVLFFVVVGCSMDKEDGIITAQIDEDTKSLAMDAAIPNSHQIVLGQEVPDVYSVEAMREAYRQLYPNGDGQHGPNAIQTTHQYVRFLPKTEEEYKSIEHYELSDIPLHLEITQGGSSYHDPSIPEDQYTWQYAVIPVGQLNTTVEYEILKELFLEEDIDDSGGVGMPGAAGPSGGSSTTMSFYETLEAASERIANGDAITQDVREGLKGAPGTRGKWVPCGRLTSYDDLLGKAIPLQNVHIVIWRNYVRHSEVVTDVNGNFRADKEFKEGYGLYYRIKWTGGADYTIYDGPFFDQAYLCVGGLTWGPWEAVINQTDYKQKQLAAIHRAAERAFKLHKDYLGMIRPSFRNQIALRYVEGANPDKQARFRGCFAVSNLFPALKVWAKYEDDNANLYWLTSDRMFNTISHELGHATHYKQISGIRGLGYAFASDNFSESWAEAVAYYVTKQEYKELGYNIDKYETLMPYNPPGMPGAMTKVIPGMPGMPGSITFITPTDDNKQYWPFESFSSTKKKKNLEYSSLIIDLIDDSNQREYYKRKKKTNYMSLPNDNVKGFTLREIQEELGDIINISGLRSRVKRLNQNHLKPNTNLEIDELFNNHTRYW